MQDRADQEEEAPAAADVELAWADAMGRPQSVILHSVPLEQTLGEFRKCCALALGVGSVVPQDFSEDMDATSLRVLSIGVSDLPFFVAMAAPGESTTEEVVAESQSSEGAAAAVASA